MAEMQENLEEPKEKLLKSLQESEAEIRALKSVASRASELEGDVARLQHELITATTALGDVNKELTDVKFTLDGFRKIENDKGNEFNAERDFFITELNQKEKEIVSLRAKIEDAMVMAARNGDENKDIQNLEAKVSELERKLEDKIRVIKCFQKEKERESIVVQGWPLIAASLVCAVGMGGLLCYLRQPK